MDASCLLAKMLARESRAAMEKDAADAFALANEENLRRQEEMQRKQETELEEQRRQLDEHQEHLRREAELARCKGETHKLITPTRSHPFNYIQESCSKDVYLKLFSTLSIPITTSQRLKYSSSKRVVCDALRDRSCS